MNPVIVLDGNNKSALAVVRSLGMQNREVYAGAERSSAMSLHSRYVTESFTYPSPYSDRVGFVTAIVALASRCSSPPVLYALSEATYLALYDARAEFDGIALLSTPPQISVEIAFDKVATHGEAKVHGVPVVKTHLVTNRAEVEALAKTLTYPAVVKPRRSVSYKAGRGVQDTASFVHTPEELLGKFFSLRDQSGEEPIIQPFMKGEEYGFSVLAHDGSVFAESAHHRIRSLAPTGGASVVKETLTEGSVFSNMRSCAYTLTKALAWSGPMMFEFKVDSDTQQPQLMEINGRWYGSLPLAIAGGVDLPWLYYQYLTAGVIPEDVAKIQSEVVTRHWLGDVRHLFSVLTKRDKMRAHLYPSRQMALRDFWQTQPGTKSDVWRWRDPLPAVWEVLDSIAKLWK
ncbi:ATP-grasp domain-containing protein [Candidatus Pacebacteria bacterium]|nr:ATP-grasp domain-containing protein [Candidatus Paceibacterota bacterium]